MADALKGDPGLTLGHEEPLDDERPFVAMSGIEKRFGPVTALAGANFDLYQGEIHALLGENGAGKSTLMNVLYGLTRSDAGRIEIDSLPLQASILLFPLPSIVVRPYLVGGGGLFFVRIREQSAFGRSPEEESFLPALHAGGGFEIPLAGLAALRAEGRYTFVGETAPLASGKTYDPGGWRLFGALSLSF